MAPSPASGGLDRGFGIGSYRVGEKGDEPEAPGARGPPPCASLNGGCVLERSSWRAGRCVSASGSGRFERPPYEQCDKRATVSMGWWGFFEKFFSSGRRAVGCRVGRLAIAVVRPGARSWPIAAIATRRRSCGGRSARGSLLASNSVSPACLTTNDGQPIRLERRRYGRGCGKMRVSVSRHGLVFRLKPGLRTLSAACRRGGVAQRVGAPWRAAYPSSFASRSWFP